MIWPAIPRRKARQSVRTEGMCARCRCVCVLRQCCDFSRPRVRTTFLSSFSPAQTRLFSARASMKTTSVAFLKTSMHRVIFVHSRPLWKQAKHDANHGGSQGMPPYPPSLIVSLLRDRHQTSVVGRTLSSTLHCRLVSVTRTSSAWFLKLSSTLRRTRCAFKAM